jgi:hypothetical protein
MLLQPRSLGLSLVLLEAIQSLEEIQQLLIKDNHRKILI